MELEIVNQRDEQVEMIVSGTQAQGRTSADSEWEQLGTVNEFFAPGGDPLGFLAGATNIQAIPSGRSIPRPPQRRNLQPFLLISPGMHSAGS